MQHLRFLHYVDAVARSGSIRSAAETLHVAASAVNRRIQDLEEELGTPLFERLPRGVRLTAAGELFVAYARRRYADLEQVRSQIEDLHGIRRGCVRLAVSQALAPVFLPRAITEFQASHPGVTFEVKVLDHDRAIRALTDFEADLGLVFNPPSLHGLRVMAQMRCRTCAIVAPGHPLASRASVRLRDCFQYPLAMPDTSLSGRGILDDLLTTSSARPQPALVSNSFALMHGFVRTAGAVSFQIEMGVDTSTGLVAVPIEESKLLPGRVMLLSLRERALPVSAATFAENLSERLEAANQIRE